MESTELARLRRVAEKQATRQTHCGRKTGKPYDLTIWFVLDGDKLFVGTANVNRQVAGRRQNRPTITGQLSIDWASERAQNPLTPASVSSKSFLRPRPTQDLARRKHGA